MKKKAKTGAGDRDGVDDNDDSPPPEPKPQKPEPAPTKPKGTGSRRMCAGGAAVEPVLVGHGERGGEGLLQGKMVIATCVIRVRPRGNLYLVVMAVQYILGQGKRRLRLCRGARRAS
jgi:hypothetical protein